MALIDYINENKNKYFDLVDPDKDILKDLKNEDSKIKDELQKTKTELIEMINIFAGKTYGGLLTEISEVVGGYYYKDPVVNKYFIYDELADDDTLSGTWSSHVEDSKWIEFSLRNQSKYDIQTVTNETSIDVSTLIAGFESDINSLNELMTSLRTDVDVLMQERTPVGDVIVGYFPEDVVYDNYIDPDGSLLLVEDFPELFAKLGYNIGGSGKYFKVFDLRGSWIRILDMGAGIDPGRIMGSFQAEQLLSHTHNGSTEPSGAHFHKIYMGGNGGDEGAGVPSDSDSYIGTVYNTSEDGIHNHTFVTNATGGTENRMKNVALRALIKYK